MTIAENERRVAAELAMTRAAAAAKAASLAKMSTIARAGGVGSGVVTATPAASAAS